MRKVTARLSGISALSQGKYYDTEKRPGELDADYEIRTWRDRLHVNDAGNIVMPAMAFKNCLFAAAKYRGEKIPGIKGGQSTWTKHFDSGVLVFECPEVMLGNEPIKKEQADGEWFFVPSKGQRGGAKRVMKCFPFIPAGWEVSVEYVVIDDLITEEVFKRHLEAAGQFTGMGRFRPENGGFYGRFEVISMKWSE